MTSDTIAAIATPIGGVGGVGVVRISGPGALGIVKGIFKTSSNEQFVSHTVLHGWIVDNSKPVDEVMITYMAKPRTYTGEDVVEISCHGGSTVLKHVLDLAVKAGARLAYRGEFTRRAFINGKIDLAKAEAVIDLIRARTKESSLIAASHLKGSLSARINDIRTLLISLLAGIEASIDFPDEVDDVPKDQLVSIIKSAISSVENLVDTADIGIIYREGVSVAIIGRPNVGKSSLLNALLKQERAIVAEEPGTTRDVIEESVSIKGIPVRILDTAGIRHSSDKAESLGVDRALKALGDADLVLLVMDRAENITSEDRSLIEKSAESKRIIVFNKSDKQKKLTEKELGINDPVVEISALEGRGIDNLEQTIFDQVTGNKVVAQNTDVMINLRHKQCLIRAKESLEKSAGSADRGMQGDFIAIDLKGAIAFLGEVTGDVVTEEVIDSIFEQFCVGK